MYLTLPPILSSCHFNFGINFIIAYASEKFIFCSYSLRILKRYEVNKPIKTDEDCYHEINIRNHKDRDLLTKEYAL